jgi:hypothetical protein
MARIEGSFRGEEWRIEEEDRRYKTYLDEQQKLKQASEENNEKIDDLNSVHIHSH